MTDTTTTTTDQPDVMESMGAEWLLLYKLAANPSVRDAQWMMGSTPQPREDTTERSRNAVSDPTWAAFQDSRRQDLRTAMKHAERTLQVTSNVLAKATADLRKALSRSHQDEQKSSDGD